jgi:hypothetical protein
MAIRLWPQDYERKEHITKLEKALLRNASRNFTNGHIAVGIDPVGMSTETVKMGMYISPSEGLVTLSIYPGCIVSADISNYITYVNMVEEKIYGRLIDSKILIVRNEQFKSLKFPYKHLILFPDEKIGNINVSKEQLNQLYNYTTIDFFRPTISDGREKTINQLGIFDGVRKPYDTTFKLLTDLECRAIFERLAPEYIVVVSETENVKVETKHSIATESERRITGKELEYKTFFLDEYQVAQVNDMGTGHRVILANPGAGKSVLLLSKAFKFASLYKESKVLLTCYNSNLADSYNFKRACANFGDNKNLYIMTFHKLVKKIYEEYLNSRCESNIATEEEIQKCIDYVHGGKIKLRFKAIFIDEVQNFDPLYLKLCYMLLDSSEDCTFLMAGDLNQAVRAQSRRGDVPWKRMDGIKLDFNGRVKYIEKNYRNSREIGEYIFSMLKLMNKRFSMLGMINSMEYEYNSFTMGKKPTIALKVISGIDRSRITNEVISAIKEIVGKYKIRFSDVAILFPFRKMPYLRYFFLYWLEEALREEDIPYSLIINTDGNSFCKTRLSNTTGIVLSTIESSLGLDFKAVILAGLFPYNYVYPEGGTPKEIKSWEKIGEMHETGQNLVQSQMRSIYTACSRARDILYVISDLNPGSPMEEVIKKEKSRVSASPSSAFVGKLETKPDIITNTNKPSAVVTGKSTGKPLEFVANHTIVTAEIRKTKKQTKFAIDLKKYPIQEQIIGKKVGDSFSLDEMSPTYKIIKILSN